VETGCAPFSLNGRRSNKAVLFNQHYLAGSRTEGEVLSLASSEKTGPGPVFPIELLYPGPLHDQVGGIIAAKIRIRKYSRFHLIRNTLNSVSSPTFPRQSLLTDAFVVLREPGQAVSVRAQTLFERDDSSWPIRATRRGNPSPIS
jgi:hypothetical protein